MLPECRLNLGYPLFTFVLLALFLSPDLHLVPLFLLPGRDIVSDYELIRRRSYV